MSHSTKQDSRNTVHYLLDTLPTALSISPLTEIRGEQIDRVYRYHIRGRRGDRRSISPKKKESIQPVRPSRIPHSARIVRSSRFGGNLGISGARFPQYGLRLATMFFSLFFFFFFHEGSSTKLPQSNVKPIVTICRKD